MIGAQILSVINVVEFFLTKKKLIKNRVLRGVTVQEEHKQINVQKENQNLNQ
jgi:hypothetical protein